MATTGTQLPSLEGFSAEILRPQDAGYEEARRVHNGLIDKRPGVIVRARSAEDVVEAVAYARGNGLELSVRGGGHNVAGLAVTDGGVMLDLSRLNAIEVDPDDRVVRAGAGLTWAQLNEATQAHGLAVTGGAISTTGIAGLTLGGGLGWLMSKHGLAADNLLSAVVVTADGRVLTASADEHPDLFWGLRGGGGNFGVVTEFEYRLHPVGPMITGGLVAHPIDAAPGLLRFYRDFTAGHAPDDLAAFGVLAHAPDGSGLPIAALAVGHFGQDDVARRELEPLLTYGSPLMVEVGPMPYTALNSMLDEAYPKGALNYWKANFLTELNDGVIDTMTGRFASCPSPMTSMLLEHFHGEVTRVPVKATAVQNRAPGFNFTITAVWLDAATTDENVAWTKEAFAEMKPFFGERRWLNYLGADDLAEDPASKTYGPNYERLVEVKTAYDPGNLFRLNANVAPRTG
jgi:FAD/FMN-containing dehydrogenase